jgi:RNA polymerase sigma-54 factor|tara:strand:- start:6154 stop:7692 length:1539 start_codon:yes stop_codon:yes gene_type:complete
MRFEHSQHMKLGQHMKLAPRMIQSMEILQMPLAELRERIEQELESNPILELTEFEADGPIEREDAASRDGALEVGPDSAGEFERLDDFAATHPDAAENAFETRSRDYDEVRTRARDSGDRDAKMDAMSQAPARTGSLGDQMLAQWSLCDVPDRVRALGTAVINQLDEDGYLRATFDEIAQREPRIVREIGPSDTDWELALQAVQLMLEPAGVAARDARECLLIQIDTLADRAMEDPDAPMVDLEALGSARRLVAEFFDDLMKNRLPKIATRSGLTLEEINAGIEQLRRLSLAPARGLSDDTPHAIYPDATVEYDEENDRYFAYLNDGRLPNVRVSAEYERLAKDRATDKRDREFLRKNLSNATWLIDAVEQRRRTLLRVINAVIDEQRDFFDFGPEALKPLPMKTIADRLGIHVATVSRAVSEKYLMTPRGVVPLRSFFSGGLATESGEDVSANSVRASIEELIENEDKAKPLSDEAMVKILNEKGIDIARRTVAKYRDQLGIPTARMRKQF